MSQKQTSRFCSHCQDRRLAVGRAPNHLLHFFLSLFTFGLWLVVWIVVSVTVENYRCTKCGSPV